MDFGSVKLTVVSSLGASRETKEVTGSNGRVDGLERVTLLPLALIFLITTMGVGTRS
jgi:preprotein translocase subunit SecG